ncbi:MAG: hypothetical protein QXI59_01565 [Candidatus Bathyarchaeia archaeon]
MSSTVQELIGLVEVERKAEQRIKEAREKAEEILRRARDEANRILMVEQNLSRETYTHTKEFEERKRRMEGEQMEKIRILNMIAQKNLERAVNHIIQEVMRLEL